MLPFDWKDWRLPSTPAAAYRFKRRPKYSPTERSDLWDATLELEKLP